MVEDSLEDIVPNAVIAPMLDEDVSRVKFRMSVLEVNVLLWNNISNKMKQKDIMMLVEFSYGMVVLLTWDLYQNVMYIWMKNGKDGK